MKKLAYSSELIKTAATLAGLAAPTWLLVKLGRLPDWATDLAAIVLGASGIAMALVVVVLGSVIGMLGQKRAAALIIGTVTLGVALTVGYASLSRELIVEANTWRGGVLTRSERYIKPLFPTPALRATLEECGGEYRYAVVNCEDMPERMRRESGAALGTLIATLMLAQLLLVGAIVGGAWWIVEQERAPTRKPASPKRETPPAGKP